MIFFVLLLTVLGLELLAATLAYYTMGFVGSLLMFFLVVALNCLVVFFYYTMANKKVAYLAMIIIALMLVPYQIILGVRWWHLHQEASKIIEYVYVYKAEKGQYPDNLSNYPYQNAALHKHIGYSLRANCHGFCLGYYVDTPGTVHGYNPKDGWFYIDD